MIKLIALDFNGVIVAGSYKDISAHLAKKYSLDPDYVYKVIYSYHEQAALRTLPEEEIFRRGLKDLHINEDPAEVEKYHFKLTAVRNEQEIAYAQELRKRGYTVIALSKNVPRAFAETIRLSNVTKDFDACINTYDLKLPKGSTETIDWLIHEFHLASPEEIIFIDDQQNNLNEASKMGVYTRLYRNFEDMKEFVESLCN